MLIQEVLTDSEDIMLSSYKVTHSEDDEYRSKHASHAARKIDHIGEKLSELKNKLLGFV